MAVRFVLSHIDSPGLQKERKERFLMKKNMLQQHIGQDVSEKASVPGIEASERITRNALEEEARQISIRGHGSPEQTYEPRACPHPSRG